MQYLIQNLNRQHWIAVVDKKTYHVITFFGLVAQVVCCYYCNNISSMWTMTFYRRQLATHLMETNSTFLIYGIYSLERWNILLLGNQYLFWTWNFNVKVCLMFGYRHGFSNELLRIEEKRNSKYGNNFIPSFRYRPEYCRVFQHYNKVLNALS